MTATRELADFVAGLSYDSIPSDVSERAKLLIMDTVGIALRARHEAASTDSLLAAVERLGLNQGSAAVIGDNATYAPTAAALINGALSHSLDFDDTHAPGSIHPSAPIVPAALAAAELTGADGKAIIAGVVAGYEVQIRLSLALVPKDHYARGFHPSATCGTFGAAAAAANVMGLAGQAVDSAFGICLSQTAGSMQYLHDGAWTKLFQVGYAAMNGLTAATLAAEGFRGPTESLEGRFGFLHAYAPNASKERVTAGLGDVFETLNIAVKPYPSCRYSHAAIDAVIELKQLHGLEAANVESIEIGIPSTGMPLIGEPLADKQSPENVVDGQFSMPFVAAVAMREGRMGWDDYGPHLADAETLALCKRIDVVADPLAEAEFPANLSGVARIRTNQETFEKLVVIPKGEPDNFLSTDELRAKFDILTGPYLSESRQQQLATSLTDLEKQRSAHELFELTRPAEPTPLQAAAGDD